MPEQREPELPILTPPQVSISCLDGQKIIPVVTKALWPQYQGGVPMGSR